MTILIINDTAYLNPKGFIADGCHKIWLIRNETDMANMREAGWDDTDIHDIHDLPEAWKDSCPLRFIETGTLKDIIPQGHETDEAHIQLIDDIDCGEGTTQDNTIDGIISQLLAYRNEYGGDMLVTASSGTDEARTDYEFSDMYAIETEPNEYGRHNMHYADDDEKPVLDILL